MLHVLSCAFDGSRAPWFIARCLEFVCEASRVWKVFFFNPKKQFVNVNKS